MNMLILSRIVKYLTITDKNTIFVPEKNSATMENDETARGVILQMLRTRMAFRQSLQGVLKRNNVDMTFEMLQVMSCLWQEQGISQQILAQKTAKDKACMTSLLSNLEKKGWVVRGEDPLDRRNRLVHLTEAGRELSQRVQPLIRQFYSRVAGRMGGEELRICSAGLQQLYEIFNQL